jgi:uncharacterized protein with FMN-binding domain
MHRSIPAVISTVVAVAPTGVAMTAGAEAATHATTSVAASNYSGSRVSMRYGIVQVFITVKGKRVVNVYQSLPTDRPRSRFINGRAGPALRSEALRAQSAKINVVSGATLTSKAYTQSLQAALNAAHV